MLNSFWGGCCGCPTATRRRADALNKSYARLVSQHFAEAAKNLQDKLVKMGFEEREAEANIQPEQLELAGRLLGEQERPCPTVAIEVDATVEEAQTIAHGIPDDRITVVVNLSEKPKSRSKAFSSPRRRNSFTLRRPSVFTVICNNAIARWEVENAHAVAPAQRAKRLWCHG